MPNPFNRHPMYGVRFLPLRLYLADWLCDAIPFACRPELVAWAFGNGDDLMIAIQNAMNRQTCRRDMERTGSCWCGKLQNEQEPMP